MSAIRLGCTLLLAAGGGAFLPGCGQKGPLYLPAPASAAPTGASAPAAPTTSSPHTP